MDLSIIIESVIPLFIIILVGVYSSNRKIITKKINKGLVDLLVKVALPFMILSSFIYTYDEAIKSNIIDTFYYSLIAYIVMIIVSYVFLFPIKKDKKTILHFSNVFVNTGYVGFPILFSIYGAQGVIYGSIFNMFFVILIWTYGIILFKGNFNRSDLKSELKTILVNPSILAVCLGLIIMAFDIRLPGPLLSSIESIGSITGPLSMLIIGVILSNVKIKKYLKDWTIYYGVTIKLLIIPSIIYLISLLIEPSKALNSVVIMSAMPASTMTSILAESFNKEKEYAAIIVSITTLLSLITIPLLLRFLL